MKTHLRSSSLVRRAAAALFSLALGSGAFAASLDTQFWYDGLLNYNGTPANGNFDFQAKLFDDQSNNNNQIGNTVLVPNVSVLNGLSHFSLDFGPVFDGTKLWLDLQVRPSGGQNWQALSPRMLLTASPYALFAPTSGSANSVANGGVSAASIQNATITAAKIASGQVVTAVNGLHDAVSLQAGSGISLSPSGNTLTIGSTGSGLGWSLTGNAGTTAGANFLGTLDYQPLELKVNDSRGLRLEPFSRTTGTGPYFTDTSINVVAGYWGNTIDSGVLGGTIAGGGHEDTTTVYPNEVSADFGTIGGGAANWIRDTGATFGTIGGGKGNVVRASYGMVPGGLGNLVMGIGSLAAGKYATALHDGCFVWNDSTGTPPIINGQFTTYDNPTTGANQFRIKATGGVFFSPATSLYFGNQTRQMLNLWGTQYGVGVQAGIQYSRSDGDFAWYQHGSHSDTYGDPGLGGATLMTLTDHYLTVTGFGGEQAYIGGDGLGNDVQVGSVNPTVTDVYMWNTASGLMNLHALNTSVCTLTITGGCDLAEPFQVSENEIPKGSVVIIDAEHPGKLKLSSKPYDTRVAGVVSGAGGVQPGIQMSQKGVLEGMENVALTGRVYVLADASQGPIQPGDLLTTSTIPGHAMKVTDHTQAQGAILGKAMSTLTEGQGLVLSLVTLQ
jgi:hypothetical protein